MGEDGTMGRDRERDRDGKGEEKGMINPFETDRTSGDRNAVPGKDQSNTLCAMTVNSYHESLPKK